MMKYSGHTMTCNCIGTYIQIPSLINQKFLKAKVLSIQNFSLSVYYVLIESIKRKQTDLLMNGNAYDCYTPIIIYLHADNWNYKHLPTCTSRLICVFFFNWVGISFLIFFLHHCFMLCNDSWSNWFLRICIFSRKKRFKNTADDENDVFWLTHIIWATVYEMEDFIEVRMSRKKKNKLILY